MRVTDTVSAQSRSLSLAGARTASATVGRRRSSCSRGVTCRCFPERGAVTPSLRGFLASFVVRDAGGQDDRGAGGACQGLGHVPLQLRPAALLRAVADGGRLVGSLQRQNRALRAGAGPARQLAAHRGPPTRDPFSALV